MKEIRFANEQIIPEVIRMLEDGHTVTLRLRGNSMRPFLEDNRDKALLAKPHTPKVGQAVLAEIAPQKYVLHRIVSLQAEHVVLRGDGNLGTEHCQRCDIKGVVLGFYRKGRKHMDSTEGYKWKVYSWLWGNLYPIRRYLLAAYRKLWIPLLGPI